VAYTTATTQVRLMAYLSRLLTRGGVGAAGLTPAVADAYLTERRAAGYAGYVVPAHCDLPHMGPPFGALRWQERQSPVPRPEWSLGGPYPTPWFWSYGRCVVAVAICG
jgi:hypothetical protein